MPLLLNTKHEKFAHSLARGANIIDAYVSAGFARNAASASKVAARPEVKARVAELVEFRNRLAVQNEIKTSADVARKLGITKETIISSLLQNAQRCLTGKLAVDEDGREIPSKYAIKPDASGANRALQLLGMEAFGMFVERHEVGNPGDFSRLSDSELAEAITENIEALGLDSKAAEAFLAGFEGDGVKH